MIKISNVLILLILQITSDSLVARGKEFSSNIGMYFLKKDDLMSQKKFINDTPKTFVLVWQIAIPNTDIAYGQHTVLRPGCSYELDALTAIEHLKSKSDKNIINYEVSLALGVVTKAPVRLNMDFESRGLKGAEKGLRIMKKDFLRHNTFTLGKDKNGKILYKVVS